MIIFVDVNPSHSLSDAIIEIFDYQFRLIDQSSKVDSIYL